MQSSNLDALSMLSWVHLIVYLPRLYIKSASLIVGVLHFHFNVRLSITFLYQQREKTYFAPTPSVGNSFGSQADII